MQREYDDLFMWALCLSVRPPSKQGLISKHGNIEARLFEQKNAGNVLQHGHVTSSSDPHISRRTVSFVDWESLWLEP